MSRFFHRAAGTVFRATQRCILAAMLILCSTGILNSQTIHNADFEAWQLDPINMQTGQIYRCQDWIRVSGGNTDPDYFHRRCQTACGNASAGMPQNQRGFAMDVSLKDGYAGCLTQHDNGGWYEYIRGTVSGLTPGTRYNVRFHVRLGDVSDLAFNGLQACISELDWLADPNQPTWTGRLPQQFDAQIQRPPGDWVADPSYWHIVSGSFVATAATEFIYVGYFGDINDNTANLVQRRDCISFTPPNDWTHYYVDEFSISESVVSQPDCCESDQIVMESTSTANCCIELKLSDVDIESQQDLCRIGGVRISIDENYLSQFSPPTSRLIRTDNTNLWDASVAEELTAITWRFPVHGQHLFPGESATMGVFCLNNPLAGAFYIPVVIEILADDGVTVLCKKTILVDCDPV